MFRPGGGPIINSVPESTIFYIAVFGRFGANAVAAAYGPPPAFFGAAALGAKCLYVC